MWWWVAIAAVFAAWAYWPRFIEHIRETPTEEEPSDE